MTIKLYDTARKTAVSVRVTRQFLQDLNLIMATRRMDASDIIRQSVHAQADAIRGELTHAWAVSLQKEEQK